MESSFASYVTHPVFILAAAAAIFLLAAWMALPFAIYGVRRRLDQVVENLERIQKALRIQTALDQDEEGGDVENLAPLRGTERNGNLHAARRLLVDLRKELLRFAPTMHERVLDPENIVVFCRNNEGLDMPCLVLSLAESGVQISVPLQSLEEAFSGFSSEQFRDYAVSFLPEKYGFYAVASADGKELQVNIETRESNPLDLFIGIIREQMYDPIQGGAL